MHTRTKIVCTMGPAVATYEKVLELIEAGMNVARLNMSHGTHADHLQTIERIKGARAAKGVPIAIMLDTKGPEIRVGEVKGNEISLETGQKLLLVKELVEGSEKGVSINPPEVLDDIDVGTVVLFDDGYISSKVIEKTKEGVVVEIQNRGILKSRKGVNIPHVHLSLPAVTQKDIDDIVFGCENSIDLIAASFIRSSEHVLEIKGLLAKQKASHVLVLSKIECALGVKNFDSILNVSDGIMVARGDLGVEVPLTHVPKLQKEMIRKCYQSFKPVVTATQMLETMIKNPRPTRAEISDVANAVYDSTSAIMLSGETASGAYPIEAVKIMRSTADEAERDFNYSEFFYNDVARRTFHDISSSVALAAVRTAYSANGKALIALTASGFTARMMERFRPEMPIIAITPNEKTYHQLALFWGVVPVLAKVSDVKEGVKKAGCFALQNKLLHYGDLVVVTSGTPFGVSGTTNTIVVENIGDVLVRGKPTKGKRISGKVALLLSVDAKTSYSTKDRIAIIHRCEKSDEKLLKGALAIVLQSPPEDEKSEEMAQGIANAFNIPLLSQANGACSTLKEGQLITLDPERGLIFDGLIESDEVMTAKVCEA